MRFFLKRPVRGSAHPRPKRIHNSRRLSFEQLGSRQLLAADIAELAEDNAVYVAPNSVENSTQLAVDSPLWGESAKSGGTAAMSNGDGYGGYGGYGFIAPEISGFFATESTPGMWTITGRVTDDESVTGLIVHFGGVLEGQSTMVREDGTFEHIILLDPNTVGIATAVVTDWDGITSETAECTIG
jgi:hypothetical protein